ncbi:MAG: ABC transporter permease subunit, partial [Candidatus Limnocylindria bacterium]
MNARLLLQTLRWQRARLAIVALAAFGWGMLIPLFYAVFSDVLRDLANSGAIPNELLNFGSGSFYTMPGAITIGFQHPLAIAMVGIFATGATATAIAGERQRGTLEVMLSRPLSRTTVYVTLAVALLVAIGVVLAALLAGIGAGSVVQGLAAEFDAGRLPLVFAVGLLLWGAFAAFGLAASVSFDRPGPAVGLSLAYLVVNYFLEILGSLWTDVAWSQEYSLIHHFQPGEILTGALDPLDLAILGA